MLGFGNKKSKVGGRHRSGSSSNGCSPLPSIRFNRCKCGRERVKKNSWAVITRDAFDTLSEENKDSVFQDLYGVSDGIEENEQFVTEKLAELDNVLSSIPTENKESYLLALDEEDKQGTEYVRSTKFNLMFLRADRFKPTLAAKRIIHFFSEKRELFGIEKLPRRLVQADLDDEDKKCLFSGYMYISDDVECFGRTTAVLRRENLVFNDIINWKRAMFYYFMASIEDNENSQKRGIVVINYAVEDTSASRQFVKLIREHLSTMMKMAYLGLPTKIASNHHCCSNFIDDLILSLRLQYLRPEVRARCQQHYGSHTKCRSLLISYGININKLCIRSNGEYKIEFLKSNLEKLRKKEERRIEEQGFL